MSTIPFISWLGHGTANLAPPGVFTDAKVAFFVIDAERRAVQKLAEELINRAGAGTVRYEAISSHAMLSFMDVAKCTSATDIAGWLPGRECAIWVPLLEVHQGHPTRNRIVFWSPYIFINYAIGMVIGRETWGWPKVLANISVPSEGSIPCFSCVSTYFPRLSVETQGVTTEVLYRVVGDTPLDSQSIWSTGAEAAASLTGAVLEGVDAVLAPLRLQLQLSCVALKQFREAGDAANACYQALCDSPVAITRFHGGGLLRGKFTVEITTCESHPIVEDLLGRKADPNSTRLPVKFAAWSKVDFEAVSGGNIVVR
jgi:hypothetical protein